MIIAKGSGFRASSVDGELWFNGVVICPVVEREQNMGAKQGRFRV